jgi:hypothetical protein
VQYAIGKWILPIVIVEVDPNDFDGDDGQLLERLKAHFMVDVALITPDWEAPIGIRARGLACPIRVLAEQDLEWREFEFPPEELLPF